MTRVFLSASYPSGDRGEEVRPYSLTDIDLASTEVIESTLRNGSYLRFGGHPAISPLVLDVASLLRSGPLVELFQSLYFAKDFTPEVRRLVADQGAALTEIPEHPEGLDSSLLAMRTEMFSQHIDAAFFIGGMSGVRDELRLLHSTRPGTAIFLMHEPGGMARIMAEDPEIKGLARVKVLRGPAYGALVSDELDNLV